MEGIAVAVGARDAVPAVVSVPAFAASPSDEEVGLVEAAGAGDRRAFGVLFRRRARMVHGLLLARVRAAEVDDLMQDVFVTALERLAELRDPAAFGGWLAQIARSRVADFHRRRRPAEPLPDEIPHEDADRAEAERVLGAIRALPEAYRDTLVLRLVEGMTGPEIAAQVGLTPESVRVNLHRGMKLLRERLGVEERS